MSTEAEQQLLHDARNGNAEEVKQLLDTMDKGEISFDINCKGRSKSNMGWTPLHLACYFGHAVVVEDLLKAGADVNVLNDMGDTPLHRAAFTGRKEVVMLLLQHNADTSIVNGSGETAKEVTHDKDIRNMLEAVERTQERKLEELLLGAAREGEVGKLTALLNKPKPPDINCTDQMGNTPLHCAAYRAHKHCALKLLKNGADPKIRNKNGYQQTPETIRRSPMEGQGTSELAILVVFQKAQACQLRLSKEISDFLAMVKSLDATKGISSPLLQKVDVVSEVSQETCEALADCLNLFMKQEGVRNLKLEHEQEKNKILSEALETLATEHHELEQSLVKGSPPLSILSEEQFYDAVSDSESEKSLSGFETTAAYSLEDNMDSKDTITSSMSEEKVCGSGESLSNGIKKHRTSLPSPMFSRNDFSIWSILRKCIGMELSKITMPVIFNEPLSFLQRLTEYMEHTYLIHKASSLSSTTERMQCVAAFAVSAVASQWERTGKPFNPLLGETYELIRDDLGFRLLSEQVSHHPPISAFYAEGLNNDFVFHGSIYPKLKFWGKSVEAEPKGTMTLELLEHNEAYTWTNPTCCVHNIIVGKLWIEQYGNVEITNHKTGEKCVLSFKPCGLFGKELHKVEGYIQDKSKKKLCALYGKWTECLYSVDPATFEAYKKNDKKSTEEKKSSKQVGNTEESDEMPLPDSESVYVIPGSVLLWKITPRPPNSAQMYNFTSFAMALNELDKEMESVIPKTDCRLRPDIRAMENGEIDLASEEKKRLEEKQRTARKNRSKSEEDWKTRWFHQGPNPHTGTQDWLYSGNYWDRNYFNLPDIY
ncbi:hypothetical protein BTVI_74357 [Pitangus sulphuratus]|nr:hypothetical protein BTVI_74357 [Pitangus sulphuratus]